MDEVIAAVAAEESEQVETVADAGVEIAQIEADAQVAIAAEATDQVEAMADAQVGVAEAEARGLEEWQRSQAEAMAALAQGQAALAMGLERLTSLLTPTPQPELVVVPAEGSLPEAEAAAEIEAVAELQENEAGPRESLANPLEPEIQRRRRRVAF